MVEKHIEGTANNDRVIIPGQNRNISHSAFRILISPSPTFPGLSPAFRRGRPGNVATRRGALNLDFGKSAPRTGGHIAVITCDYGLETMSNFTVDPSESLKFLPVDIENTSLKRNH
ncbi:hypothetical protein J6590_028858 [Homalodisca vitripennis]|nr:hypothetical protein J6590_028858 [Homalodisca vitripennis]